MPKYVIESPHEEDECLQALDELGEKGEDILAKFVFACKAGEHTGWAYVEADDEDAALDIVPESVRDKASVHEVEKLTMEQIKEFHTEK